MHDAKEMATWNVASWILAMLTRCQTTEANGIKFEPAKWHEPGMRVEVARKEAEKKRKAAARAAAMNCPEYLANLKAERLAEWDAFQAALKGRIVP